MDIKEFAFPDEENTSIWDENYKFSKSIKGTDLYITLPPIPLLFKLRFFTSIKISKSVKIPEYSIPMAMAIYENVKKEIEKKGIKKILICGIGTSAPTAYYLRRALEGNVVNYVQCYYLYPNNFFVKGVREEIKGSYDWIQDSTNLKKTNSMLIPGGKYKFRNMVKSTPED